MRKRRGGMSTLTVGLVALVVTIIGVYLGFTKSIPFRSHYEVKAAFKSANNIRQGIAGADRRRRGRQGHEDRARPRGRRGRRPHDADPGQGPPAAPRRALQDPPAHLPRGQLLRRRHARHVEPRGRRQPHVPGPADRHAGAARRGPDRAADRHPRGPQDGAARVLVGPRRARAPRASTARSSTGSRPTATRRSSPRRRSARRSTTSRATSTAAASWPARSTATASSSRT